MKIDIIKEKEEGRVRYHIRIEFDVDDYIYIPDKEYNDFLYKKDVTIFIKDFLK